MSNPLQYTSGIVAVHPLKTAFGQVEAIIESTFSQAMKRRLADVLGGIVDQDGDR